MTLFEPLEGILLIDKPKGMTSHDVVSRLRRILKIKRIGHTGTLDPDATGLLVICVGKATKSSATLSDVDKTYRVGFRLGVETDTYDETGDVVARNDDVSVSEGKLQETIRGFVGEQEQQVPLFSAVKVNGRKLYEYARKGIEVTPPTRQVKIHSIDLLSFASPNGEMEVSCSKGTYVRSLIHDMGKKLGTGAITTEIRRVQCGSVRVSEAVSLEEVMKAENAYENLSRALIPTSVGLSRFPSTAA
ncbi:MAG: tRNA pseudouridine(55) synthase TruB [Pseudomonadota bacterium]